MKTKIILIETSDIGARYTAEAVRRLGHEPVFLVNLANYQGDTLQQIKQFEHYQVDTTSIEAMLNFIRLQSWQIAAVTTFLDSRLHLAIQMAQALNVRGLDPALLPFKDKAAVCKLGESFSPPSVSFSKHDIPLAEIESLRKSFPSIILKPRCTAGGIGAREFAASEPISEILGHLNSLEIPNHLQPTEWMAQAFVQGELVSAEGYVKNGVTTILGFTGRRKVGNTESWCGFPYEARMPVLSLADAQSKVVNLMDATGIQNAFFHIELMINAESAYIIDANLGRMGGGGIGEMFASSFGVTPSDIFVEVLKVTLFPEKEMSIFWESAPQVSISVNYGIAREATLLSVTPVTISSEIFSTRILDAGSIAPAMGTNNWAWIGIVGGLEAEVLQCLRDLRLMTDVGCLPVCFALPDASGL
ncbi:MAG: hypothetical protein H7326_03650 [Bdellovibrionaceae bacterium]|nr:hypothetical protein [Pseudobdellovibrionaceae bacterium]